MWSIYDNGNLVYTDDYAAAVLVDLSSEHIGSLVGVARVGRSLVGDESVKYGGRRIYSSGDFVATNVKYSQDLGKAGTLTFTVYPFHFYYDNFVALSDRIELYRDSDLYWVGRIYSISVSLSGAKTITCEGLLAVLNDSILRPCITDSNGESAQIIYDEPINDLLTAFIDQHNSQVGSSKKLVMGQCGSTSSEILYRAYENYDTTYNRVYDLADSLSAYPRIRTENGVDYLDFLQETDYASYVSSHTVGFGENLLTLTQEQAADGFITVLIPLGADVEDDANDTAYPLTIASVNNGLDYIEADADILAKYGRIVATKTWDDVTTPAQLLTKGREYLNAQAQTFVTITATSVDMAKAGSSVEEWRLGDRIAVTSAPHGLNEVEFIVKSLSLDLQNPANNKLSLSQTRAGIAEFNRAAERNIVKKLYTVNQNIYNVAGAVKEYLITVNESSIEQTADAIRLYCRSFLTDEEYEACENDISALFEVTAGAILSRFQSLWIQESEEGIRVGRDGSTMQSLQDNDSYEFIDTSTNSTVVTLDTTGLTSTRVGAQQIELMDGDVKQWAIRKGAKVSGTGVGLDFVWIGG